MRWKSFLLLIASIFIAGSTAAQKKELNLDVPAPDGVKLKASYYSPGKPGPGILLLHQCNMDRRSWTTLATKLVERGIHVMTFDYRGYGESPKTDGSKNLPGDIDAAFETLMSQPGVDKNRLAVGGASCGVNNTVQLARRNGRIKALMLLSGPVTSEGLAFLKEYSTIAIFGAASSEEAFAVSTIREMVAKSTNPATTIQELKNAGHGVEMFDAEPMLLKMIVDWLAKVLG
ncbi:MAG TPA: alpha/beta fold hydrolase [Bacteroidota bacterium]